ncbi:YjcZ family sporulation protein [Paenibacillus sp. GCM10027628]
MGVAVGTTGAGYGGFTSSAAVLVLFILLVIITMTFVW